MTNPDKKPPKHYRDDARTLSEVFRANPFVQSIYNEIKDELPDGMSLEDMCDEMEDFCQ